MGKIKNSILIVVFFLSCQTNQEKIYYKFQKGVQDELDSISSYSNIYRIFLATEKKILIFKLILLIMKKI